MWLNLLSCIRIWAWCARLQRQMPKQHAVASCSASLAAQEKIRTALEAEKVEVTDAYGNGQHVSIDVVSDLFEGQSSMKRQRMVYKV